MHEAQHDEELGAGDVVIIGVDPHKASVTIEARDTREILRATGTFPTTTAGHAAMVKLARQWPRRVWAVEGARGVGRALVARLVANGERVVDVPAKLSARSRVFDTGQGRKTDSHDAHAIVMVALRDKRLREVVIDEDLEVLRLLVDRRDELAAARTQALNRAHRLFAEVTPGGAPTKKSIAQYQALLAGIRPRDGAGKVRRRMLSEELTEAHRLDVRVKELTAEIKAAVLARGSHLMDLPGIGPAGAGRILADVGNVARFPSRHHFASWTGTAPIDASSGAHQRHRLSRAGNRRLNHVLHIAATVRPDAPPRHPRQGVLRPQEGRRQATLEAMRCLKRRLSDVVYRQLVKDAVVAEIATMNAGPGGHGGATVQSSAAGLPPHTGTLDQPLPGPAPSTLDPTTTARQVSITAG
ncbi:IS110 family transposase [Cellulomonas sp. ATA003]|uniref:IS110 family transposase n=1 Tax=Cellulomonas sp. ATA003 TaxID=3073064 RepID=UPI002873C135|nr:IS110 family transposase [Cellulomonas sp. ATA003]WNB84342.1 IS110 family transposase [Cellulomonas sp. ATA003]